MNKNLSLTSLLAIAMFLVSTFLTSKFQTSFGETDKFGFPFVFFSASSGSEVVNNQSFSILSFISDLAIYFAIAYGLVSLLSLLKVERKTPATA